jgi:hypothetical protein
VRAGTNGGFQFNLWIPDPPPKRDAAAEDACPASLAIAVANAGGLGGCGALMMHRQIGKNRAGGRSRATALARDARIAELAF